ncbi:MAG: ABC transporter substrate-binding protein [Candidatus Brocadiae bacterium]|nr:ABC transporter substrate-binding protein [Candidatus Brocadiia bacterium]
MRRLTAVALLTLALLGCDERTRQPADGKIVIELWHSQKRQNDKALQAVVARFNAQSPTYEVKLANFVDYTALFRKMSLAAQGGVLPDLGIAYESMVVELMQVDVVEPLDPYLNHPVYGLPKADQGDIFPSFLNSNRYPEFGGKLLSFPFTKSLLILYYNQDLLRAAGHEAPPATWKQFVQQCRDVKAKTGKTPFAYSRDASSFDGMVMGYGGVLAPDKGARSGFDSPEALKAFGLLHTLASGGLARVIPLKSDDDRLYFSNQECAFILRSSTTRSYMRKDLVDEQGKDRFNWSCACPPVGEGQPKLTVLYGGNIVMFKSTPERQRGAWEFIKFFVSREVTAEWSVKTGYLPVRKSAAELRDLKAFLDEHPRNRAIFDTIPFGVREPSVAGWQRIRDDIAKAVTRVVEGRSTPAEAAAELTKEADAALARHRR